MSDSVKFHSALKQIPRIKGFHKLEATRSINPLTDLSVDINGIEINPNGFTVTASVEFSSDMIINCSEQGLKNLRTKHTKTNSIKADTSIYSLSDVQDAVNRYLESPSNALDDKSELLDTSSTKISQVQAEHLDYYVSTLLTEMAQDFVSDFQFAFDFHLKQYNSYIDDYIKRNYGLYLTKSIESLNDLITGDEYKDLCSKESELKNIESQISALQSRQKLLENELTTAKLSVYENYIAENK